MNSFAQADVQEILDQVMRDMTERYAGIQLCKRDSEPSGDICTVYTTFEGSYHGPLVLCADTAFMTRLAQRVLQEEIIDPNDLEDLIKEYFNVICGQIVAGLFRAFHVPASFRIPVFYSGRFIPDGEEELRGVINYTSDCNESAKLIHQLTAA